MVEVLLAVFTRAGHSPPVCQVCQPVPLEASPGVGRVAAPAQSVNPNHQKVCLFSVKIDGWMDERWTWPRVQHHLFTLSWSICLKTFACSPCIGPKRPVQGGECGGFGGCKPMAHESSSHFGGLYHPFPLNLLIVDLLGLGLPHCQAHPAARKIRKDSLLCWPFSTLGPASHMSETWLWSSRPLIFVMGLLNLRILKPSKMSIPNLGGLTQQIAGWYLDSL